MTKPAFFIPGDDPNNDDKEYLSYLLDKGADPTAPKCTSLVPPLQTAIKLQRYDCLKILLQKGANPNKSSEGISIPHFYAIKMNDNEALKILLENGADPNLRNSQGEIAIFYAINQNNYEAVKLLIEAKSVFTYSTKSALNFAVRKDATDIVALLLRNHCKKDVIDSHGKNAFQIAVDKLDPLLAILVALPTVPEEIHDFQFLLYVNEFIEQYSSTLSKFQSQMLSDLHQPDFRSKAQSMIDLIILYAKFNKLLVSEYRKQEQLVKDLEEMPVDPVDHEVEEISKQILSLWATKTESTNQLIESLRKENASENLLDDWNVQNSKRLEMMQEILEEAKSECPPTLLHEEKVSEALAIKEKILKMQKENKKHSTQFKEKASAFFKELERRSDSERIPMSRGDFLKVISGFQLFMKTTAK